MLQLLVRKMFLASILKSHSSWYLSVVIQSNIDFFKVPGTICIVLALSLGVLPPCLLL